MANFRSVSLWPIPGHARQSDRPVIQEFHSPESFARIAQPPSLRMCLPKAGKDDPRSQEDRHVDTLISRGRLESNGRSKKLSQACRRARAHPASHRRAARSCLRFAVGMCCESVTLLLTMNESLGSSLRSLQYNEQRYEPGATSQSLQVRNKKRSPAGRVGAKLPLANIGLDPAGASLYVTAIQPGPASVPATELRLR